MIHGPCGPGTLSPCMDDHNRCTKHFPKPYLAHTEITGDSYVHTRCRDNGRFIRVGNHFVDNRYVVLYCPYLTLRYEAHINVECTAGFHAVKYIYKVRLCFISHVFSAYLFYAQYVYKGPDHASLSVHDNNNPDNAHYQPERDRDETKIYVDGCYLSAREAFWRLNGWPTHRVCHRFCLTLHLCTFSPACHVGIPSHDATPSSP